MASENTAPFYLPSADGAKLSALRRANDTLLAPRVAAITVAEGLVRELRERQPFSQGSGMGNTGNTGNTGTTGNVYAMRHAALHRAGLLFSVLLCSSLRCSAPL